MPVISLYRHGITAGIPPQSNSHARAVRNDCKGWSEASTRSNRLFLYSVDERALTGVGYALTLTLRDCPPSHDVWHRLRRSWVKRLERLGMLRLHWLTEWQRRGVPHLHGALWFPDGSQESMGAITQAWLSVAQAFKPSILSQFVRPIDDSVGWFQYLSKHAVRGLAHYQRSGDSIPPGWKEKTGRMWGRLGDWPLQEKIRAEATMQEFWTFRRIARAWRIADARGSRSPRRIRFARSALSCSDRGLSAVRGISDWIPLDVQLDILTIVKSIRSIEHE